MNILYIGNFEPRHSTENHIALTLENMGHDVLRIQEIGPDAKTAEYVRKNLVRLLPGTSFPVPVDLLLWTRTPPGLQGDTEEMFEMARYLGVPTVAYHLDLYAGLKRSIDVGKEPWWRCQWVFTADGGSDDFWKENGVNHYWMPPGVYKAECYLADAEKTSVAFQKNQPWTYDVIFTGQRNYHPEWPYRPQLIDWLTQNYGWRFRCFPMPGEHAVRNHELNVLYASTKICIGDSLCLGFDHPNYWSDRVPETLGRGGFLIMPRIQGLEEHFEDGKEIVYYDFNDWAGLKEKIDYYLERDDEREAIRRAGCARVHRDHTYHNRMEAMLEIIQKA